MDTQADPSFRWARSHFVGFVMSGSYVIPEMNQDVADKAQIHTTFFSCHFEKTNSKTTPHMAKTRELIISPRTASQLPIS